MAFLGDIFAKPASKAKQVGPSDIPTEKVIMLRDQGLTVNQIVETLQRQGYSIDLISNALNQADLKESILEQRGEKMPEEYPFEMPPVPGQMPPPPRQGAPPMPSIPPVAQPMSMAEPISEERIHEIAEAIIDEKWTELIESVNRIIEWKDATEAKIIKLQQQVEDLKNNFDKIHEGVLGKIAEYDRNIVEVGTEIKALEKVFQKILPGFMENVTELSRITAKLKTAKISPK